MTPTSDNPTQAGLEGRGGVREKLSGATSHVKHTAADFGRSAADNIDRNLTKVSGALESAATSLRQRAGAGEGTMPQIARTAAEKLDGTARYFREHDTRQMAESVGSTVRRHPGASLMAALGIGFLIGLSMKRERY